MLESDGGNEVTLFLFKRLAGLFVPVYLILMNVVITAVDSVVVVRVDHPEVELRLAALGGIDRQVVRAGAVHLGHCVICEAAREGLIICELLVAAYGAAVVIVVVAENNGEGDASVNNGLKYRLYSGIDTLGGLYLAACKLVAGEHDEVGLLCVESLLHKHYCGFSRNVDILRVGNLHDFELSVFVEAQNTVVVDCRKSGRRRGYKHRRAEHNGEQSLDLFTHDSLINPFFSQYEQHIKA